MCLDICHSVEHNANAVVRFLLSRRVLVAVTLLHVAALAGLARLQWSGDLRDRFLPEDPGIEAMAVEQDWFGTGQALALLVESADRLEAERIPDELRRWSTELSGIAGVDSARTFLDLPSVAWDGPERWHVETLGDAADPLAAALLHPLARKTMLRGDAKGLIVMLTLAGSDDRSNASQESTLDDIEAWIAQRGEPYRFTLAGSAAFRRAATAAAYQDSALLCIPLALLIGLIIYAAFRSASTVLIILGLTAVDVAVTFGSAGLLGWPLSQFSLCVVPVIITVGVLDNIHLITAYCRYRHDSSAPTEAARAAITELLAPCFWTSATTMAGFSALLMSSVPQVEQFGLLAAEATAWAFVSSLVLLPALLRRLDPPGHSRLAGALARLTELARPALIVATGLTAAAVAVPGIGRLSVHSEFPRLFVDGHAITKEFERIEEQWGGIATVSYVLTIKSGYHWSDREVFERLSDFLRLLSSRELVSSVASPLDLVAAAAVSHRARFPEALSLERSSQIVEAIVGGNTSLGGLVAPEHRALRIIVRLRSMQPEAFPALMRDLDGFRDNLGDIFDVGLSGWPLLYKNLEFTLLRELLESFALAAAAVALLMLLALRSLRWWLLSLLPNLVPLCVVLGGLGASGIGFNSGLLLAPAIALGLVVDDTIHFVFALRAELRASTGSIEVALRAALARAGSAITLTSAILLAGFGVLMLSVFRGSRLLGMVMSTVIVSAWIADLVLLPALLRLRARR